jgi:hypothetical protein
VPGDPRNQEPLSERRADGGKVREHLFDLDTDPQEKNNLIAGQPETAGRLERLLEEWEGKVRPRR